MKRSDFMKVAGVSTLGAGMVSAANGIQTGPDNAGSSQAEHEIVWTRKVPVRYTADVAVIGGGDLGCELAEYSVDLGSRVSILEIAEKIMGRTKSIPRTDLLERLENKGVKLLPQTVASAIGDDHVIALGQGNEQLKVPADQVIYAVGNRFSHELFHAIEGKVAQVHLVGDTEEPSSVGHALRGALQVALRI